MSDELPGGNRSRAGGSAPTRLSNADLPPTLVRPSDEPAPTRVQPVAQVAVSTRLGTDLPDLASTPTRDPTVPFEPGYEVRGRYTLEELIGEGSMGQVWRARDTYAQKLRYSSPEVALKVLNARFELNENAYVALHREAVRGAKLGHPNIVDVQLFDVDPRSRRAFMVMELLEGQSLEHLLRETAPDGLPRSQALALIRGMAEGLAYAHRKGIVHSDFKPGNVFVTSDGIAKILDFGISRQVRLDGGKADRAAHVDQEGLKGYTLIYAAPETIGGEEPSRAEDVFSLGLVAYEIIAGRHPFGRRSAVDARDEGITPAPLRGLKRREANAIARALSFDPGDRFADADAFIKALQGIAPLSIGLAAVASVMLVAAGGFWYRSHLASGPDVPFEQLPAAVQADVRVALNDGATAMGYLQRTRDISASQDAAFAYAKAYSLHPRNREAVDGLERAADLAIEWYLKQPDRQQALEQLRLFRQKSDFYDSYPPLLDAIAELSRT